MSRSLGFGSDRRNSIPATRGCLRGVQICLRCAWTSTRNVLSVLRRSSDGPIMQKVHGNRGGLRSPGFRSSWAGDFRHSFRLLSFTFPSQYSFTIGQRIGFSLRRWSSESSRKDADFAILHRGEAQTGTRGTREKNLGLRLSRRQCGVPNRGSESH